MADENHKRKMMEKENSCDRERWKKKLKRGGENNGKGRVVMMMMRGIQY